MLALIPVLWVGLSGHDQNGLLGTEDQLPLEFYRESTSGSFQTPFLSTCSHIFGPIFSRAEISAKISAGAEN